MMSRLVAAVLLAVALTPAAWAAGAASLRAAPPIYVDGRGAGLVRPEGIACDGKSLVVADTGNGRLVRFSFDGKTALPQPPISLPQLPYPIRVKLGPEGEILVLDGRQRKIARLDSNGAFKGYVELPEPGTVVPRSFDVDAGGTLYILDVFSGRVIVLGADGRVRRQIAFPDRYGFFSDIAVDSRGQVFVVDSVEPRIWVANAEASELSPLTDVLTADMYFPTAIEEDGQGRVFVVDQNGGGIVVFATDGTFRGRQSRYGWKDGFLRYPAAVCADPSGLLFVADRENNRVQPFIVAD